MRIGIAPTNHRGTLCLHFVEIVEKNYSCQHGSFVMSATQKKVQVHPENINMPTQQKDTEHQYNMRKIFAVCVKKNSLGG